MNAETKTIETDNTTAMIAERIRAAREDAGMSRAALSKVTGVSARTIERMEAGDQQVTVPRLRAISEATSHPLAWLQGDMDELNDTADDISSRSPRAAMVDRDIQDVRAALVRLDELRADQFEGSIRKALAMIDSLTSMLAHHEPEELFDIATSRGIDRVTLPKPRDLVELLESDPREGDDRCRALQARIIDTGIIGADLFEVPEMVLKRIADQRDLESDGMFGWKGKESLIGAVRSAVRDLALTGKLPAEIRELEPPF